MSVVLVLFPEVTDVNGDAQNALVLARRAQWGGRDAALVHVGIGDAVPGDRPLAVVLGSGVDSALAATVSALERFRPALVDWLAAGVPVLAIGTGLELLGTRVDRPEPLDGLGLVDAVSTPLPARVSDDLVVRTEWGDLVGYANHARAFDAPRADPLGAVVHGAGATDGVRAGSLFGTRLHGPVLAKNPVFADALLALAFGEPLQVGPPAAAADAAAAEARAAVLRSIGTAH